ncbi:ABC transporter ATP-binding protein [Pseudoxanthomonas sp. J35]|uniref:ABC transporter ATP-binding protein n=1 Tax=Pseudoxanthomonas sp. J35 TaxID=935852 RepID=UPI0004B6D64F|nr:ABC transporter ATP-binding protein [Pseudoxanthomonas sp. J35]
MSSEVAIRLAGVGKVFRVYAQPHHRLLQGVSRNSRWGKEFRAVSGVNLEVRRGETVGIIGRNGSGKSTLLQMICGTLRCSEGEVEINGRIAALLELGAGFNPEFTGRENVYLNASLMGMSRREIDEKYASIVAFADIGGHIDQPVKTYSSGMYIRLAFAVAINTTPDILVVDEALSVGDEAFQRKCFSRIEELKSGGCTILFVSHSASSIVELCDRAVLLDAGEMLLVSDPKTTVAMYQRLIYSPPEKREEVRALIRGMASTQMVLHKGASDSNDFVPLSGAGGGRLSPDVTTTPARELVERFEPGLRSESMVSYVSRGALISNVRIENLAGERVNILKPGESYVYRYDVAFSEDASHVHFGMMIKSTTGVDIFGMSSHAEGEGIDHVSAGERYQVSFRFKSWFLPGSYFTNAGCNGVLSDGEAVFMHRIMDAMQFRIQDRATDRRKAGFYDLAEEPACSLVVVGSGSQAVLS